METQLQILLSEEGAQAEHIAKLTGYLREELLQLQLDVDDVTAVAGPTVPPGARAGEIALIGALLVNLGGAATGLSQVLNVVRDWRRRCHGRRPSLRLTLEDDVLEISEATDQQVTEAFDRFLRRHSTVGT
ncbi:hypothetical protein I2W78_02670 [Streptomyces spinoverrucosus]|uniref:hypothetical protein n=1 Tax=Streptomyces spinoverrucosus TaxID=284043 RepID=UPI0018C3B0A1|nr:hypothetical protein [Streptomyces spinoverrucosus]MBG0850786.1 hypothetical protein [Streptomyces spinoverrucosus]